MVMAAYMIPWHGFQVGFSDKLFQMSSWHGFNEPLAHLSDRPLAWLIDEPLAWPSGETLAWCSVKLLQMSSWHGFQSSPGMAFKPAPGMALNQSSIRQIQSCLTWYRASSANACSALCWAAFTTALLAAWSLARGISAYLVPCQLRKR
eukprot:CAMPEP_0202376036 /NCGR_PEP_ID=MMETSP1127-20130417/6607_1 /ASSEMBLY_ACC=CAM_ASM_000462 /TAXON_ID=3047 /ORGANISM="Dunaliella tertiolecta, Strain CCMP1320" /LENGTH=147 /DNA_ID=CAMNT_0048973705 /DNA_START=304 /DNA_END=744 /DNA_ORIENTATION=+